MNRRHVILLCSLSIVLVGCGFPAGEPAPVVSSSSVPLVSRGYEMSTVAAGLVRSPETELAVEFVRLAATPDARLDSMPPESVLRAQSMMAPELAEKVTVEERSVDGTWWETHWGREDDYIAVNITNVLGDMPQSAPDPNEPLPRPKDEVTLEVGFLRVHHHNGVRDELRNPEMWQVAIRDGLVADFATSIDE